MTSTSTPHEYEQLKQQLVTLGLVRPGSLVRRYMPCGKPGCRCMAEPPILHGPYYQWTYRLRGKTITKRLNRRASGTMRSVDPELSQTADTQPQNRAPVAQRNGSDSAHDIVAAMCGKSRFSAHLE